MKHHRSIIILSLLILLVSIWISIFYIPKAILLWDESNHGLVAMQSAYALREGKWDTFASLNWNEFIYPPLQSIFYGIPMALVGPSYTMARYITLAWYILGAYLTFFLAKTVRPAHRFTPLVASLLYLFSPFFLLFSFQSLKETLGTTLTTLTILLYLSTDTNKLHRILLTSIALTLVSFTKYNFGILIAGIIFLEECIRLLEKTSWKTVVLRLVALFGPIGIVFLWWTFPRLGKITEYITFVNANVHQSLGMSADMTDYILFYPRSIIYSYAPTRMVGILLLAAFFLAITKLRYRHIRIFWVSIAANFILGIIRSGNVQDRYIATVVPMLFILASIIWLEYIDIVTRSIRLPNKYIIPSCAACILVLSSFGDIIRFPSYLYGLGAYMNRSPLFNQPDFQDLWFTYDTSKWATTLPSPDTPTPEMILRKIASSIDVTKPIWFVGEANEFSPPLWASILDYYKRNGQFQHTQIYSSYIIVITIQNNSIYYTHDYKTINEWKRLQFVPSEQLVHLASRTYPGIGVITDTYGVK